jgi:prepilin-type N-terminal cleavage/methylation domain-containing protein
MRSGKRGFTLIEVLVAAGVLACGLVGVAAIFSYSIRVNTTNREMAIATALAYDKMEELRAVPFNDPLWTNTAVSETVVADHQSFTRLCQFDSSIPRTVTIIIYSNVDSLRRRQTELIRLTTLISPVF